ncbi:MAG: putative lipid II flippase FtsW [Bacillota bacterium]
MIFFAVVALLGIGIVMVFSASAVRSLTQFGDRYYFLKRQLLWAVLGLSALLFFMNTDYLLLQRLAKPAFVVAMIFLVLVLVPGVGRISHGARRWIGPFQPSELVKPVIVVFLASSLAATGEKIRRFFTGLLPYLALLGLVFVLILRQPDLGTGLAVAGTVGLMLFMAGAHLGQLGALAIGALPVLAWAIFGEEYRRRRFMAFLDPWSDPGDSGYHIIQALYALGSGRLVGMGLGYGRQKYLYLPEPHTDFIFAIIGEELGFLGAATVMVLFCVLAWRGYRVAVTAQDRFGCLLAAGLTSMITLQALINLGVVTASIPITGIPLPFLSYGGSSLVFTLAGVGILLNVSRYTTESSAP